MRTVIVADDITGANVSNSLLAKAGFKVGTLEITSSLEEYKDYDALAISTASRSVSAKEAYASVLKVMGNLIKNKVSLDFYSKRIDSTLRGNLGAEIDAMLEMLPRETLAIVVPAFPTSKKIVIGDYLLVDDIPLEQTDVKNDPTTPVLSSRVTELIAKQSKHPIVHLSLDTVLKGKDAIITRLTEIKQQPAGIVVCDSCTATDLESLSDALIEMKQAFLAVDPGPFTQSLVSTFDKKSKKAGVKDNILMLMGSASPIAIEQLNHLKENLNPYIIRVDVKKICQFSNRLEEMERVVKEAVLHNADSRILVISTMVTLEDKKSLEELAVSLNQTKEQVSSAISSGLAEIGKFLVESKKVDFSAYYTSGGDVTQSFLEALSANGIQIKAEISPLSVYGKMKGGPLAGKALITKGGLVGDKTTITECINYALERLAKEGVR
ncbi:four-carbon acid sugar kinase family protein [Vagococcus fessus]|uniref:Four-carbon acid sugar kinase family protein n=1 Tax=Vagococcus fessus TaxID=120370 RepID=A0A430A822_9ENTE|nr:four-carbon acid sugar kinase family protein [Vagococcus fessus]RSU03258.1 hypothetical protein CBF31_05955 [Vagococcus fessus]